MHLPPLDIFSCSESTSLYSTVTSTLPLPTASATSRSAATSTLTAIQNLIQDVIQSSNSNSQPTERLEGQFHHVQLAKLANGDALMLKYPSSFSIRSLRHEVQSLETEYRTLLTLQEYTQLPVPEIVDYDSTGYSFGSPFLLTAHRPGIRLSEALPYISATEKKSIDRVLGYTICALASLSSSQFGPITQVFERSGSASWREAFLTLFESALRDAEDMLITLPYEFLRRCIDQHIHSLDYITEPKLVALDICNPEKVLVDENTKQVTCLLGLSNVIWGDPLMNDAIANGNDDFRQGYQSLFPEQEGDHVRQSIYAVYRAVVQIVTHHYRPHSGIDELDARRSMAHALNELAL
ncbi:hypothetical protein DM02DRAFT_616350, partial [Periconia macrospinosa]